MDLSIIIPAIREPYLEKTVESILMAAETNIEILVVMDLCELSDKIRRDKRVIVIPQQRDWGMRGSENVALERAKGKYIMKTDAHCMFAPGFDRVMIDNCSEKWLLIPRRYSLDEVNWRIDPKRPKNDYHYFTFPYYTHYGYFFTCRAWHEMASKHRDPKYDIDDLMTFQGSCWFAHHKYFTHRVGLLNGKDEAYKGFAYEPVELGLKYWLGGGKVKIIKKTWYAHLSKRKHHYMQRLFTRRYKRPKDVIATYNYGTKHWMNNQEPDLIYNFDWFINKFWPIPEWPNNWKEIWQSYKI